ncbi:MAG: hypothetical protein IJC01_01995 [Clostridia bacterium]|nr:hypothetical protein [Clostridia bacterium]
MDELRTLAKQAMRRMKSGFWEANNEKFAEFMKTFKSDGMSTSKIIEYYMIYTNQEKSPKLDKTEVFYLKVKKILDTDGEVSNMIGRLIEKDIYDSLSYEHKQKYIMELGAKYRAALERYKKEKQLQL